MPGGGWATGRLVGFVAGLFVIIAAGYWAWYQFQYSIGANNAVLIEFARRMLEGGEIGRDFYDTNPPLSVILYIPVIVIGKLTGLPYWHGLTIYVLLLSLFSAFLVWRILSSIPAIKTSEAGVLALLFLFASGYATNIFYGERDHIILLGLMPLVLAQFAITKRYKLPGHILYPALILGALAVLAKPHYGLLPFLMVVARGPRLASVLRSDLIVLGLGVVLYAGLLLTVFRPFIDVVLPDVLQFYAFQGGNPLTYHFYLFCLLLLSGIWWFLPLAKESKQFLLILLLLGFALLIAYVAQNKGLHYHILPLEITLFFVVSAFALLASPHFRHKEAFILLAGIGALLLLYPVRANYLTHAEFKLLPLSMALEECTGKPCSFLMVQEYAYIGYETALYKEAFFASRFPSLWFQPTIVCGLVSSDKDQQVSARSLYKKYAAMITEDFTRYRPEILVLDQKPLICDGGEVRADLFTFMAEYPPFTEVRKWYDCRRAQPVNRRAYYRDTSADFDYSINFEICKRKEL